MQCKDISELPILRILIKQPNVWHTWFEGAEFMPTVRPGFPPNTPNKLILAKLRMMYRRGLIDGCPCGCRGDFTITPKGVQFFHDNDGPIVDS